VSFSWVGLWSALVAHSDWQTVLQDRMVKG